MTQETDDYEELIQFAGMNFSVEEQGVKFIKFSEKVTTRLELYRSNIKRYLNQRKESGSINQKDGMVMFADDQFVVRQIMQVFFDEIGILDRVIFCKNGEEVVEYFKEFFNGLRTENLRSSKPDRQRPVTLLLMDINMPYKSGLEARKEVCEMFDEFNTQL